MFTSLATGPSVQMEAVSLSCNISSTIAYVGTFCCSGKFSSSQGSQIVKTIEGLISLKSPHFCYFKSTQQKRSFLVSTNWISPSPVIKVCNVFTNNVLWSSCGRQSKSNGKSQCSLTVCRKLHTNTSVAGITGTRIFIQQPMASGSPYYSLRS